MNMGFDKPYTCNNLYTVVHIKLTPKHYTIDIMITQFVVRANQNSTSWVNSNHGKWNSRNQTKYIQLRPIQIDLN